MNWSRILCAFGRHDLTGWRKITPANYPDDGAPHNERHCKRKGCAFKETREPKKRTRAQQKRQLAEANEVANRG